MWVRARLFRLQKGCTWLAVASDKVYQLLAHGRWFPPGTPAASTTNTGGHDIAEILLKVALSTINQISQIKYKLYWCRRHIYFTKSMVHETGTEYHYLIISLYGSCCLIFMFCVIFCLMYPYCFRFESDSHSVYFYVLYYNLLLRMVSHFHQTSLWNFLNRLRQEQ